MSVLADAVWVANSITGGIVGIVTSNKHSMYTHIKEHLHTAGELMIKASDGQTFELHLHNTSFDDAQQLIELETGVETYWINPNEVIYTWIHREKG